MSTTLMISRRVILKGMTISGLGGFRLADSCFASPQSKQMLNRETKIFDPADGFAPITDVFILTDATVTKRDDRWWMYLAGRAQNRESIELFSASLPPGAPLAATGWILTANQNDKTKIADLADHEASKAWDSKADVTVRLTSRAGIRIAAPKSSGFTTRAAPQTSGALTRSATSNGMEPNGSINPHQCLSPTKSGSMAAFMNQT